jgi:hypothetical protein
VQSLAERVRRFHRLYLFYLWHARTIMLENRKNEVPLFFA